MPFPWKKNRVTRISRIVADLQSPKRGGSLVVETGFPTSLIDLFVKNRSRFKKPRSNKPVRTETPDPPPPPPPPSPETSPPSVPSVPLAEDPTLSPSIGGKTDDGASSGRAAECGHGSGSGVNTMVAKVLLVVVLVASVKRLTVGITVSAFALLFLEYASKRVVSCLGPCSNATKVLKNFSQRFSSCVLFQKLPLRLKLKERESATGRVEFSSSDSLSVDEIQVVEENIEVEICCELMEDDSSKEIVDEARPCEVTESKIRGSRSGRLKSKMVKKLFPKKFRASKKTDNKGSKHGEAEPGGEVSSAVAEDKKRSFEIDEVEEEDEIDRGISKLDCIIGDHVAVRGITCSQELSNENKLDRIRNGNSGYIILLIITLIGLLVGRFSALILVTSWCFLLKIVKTLWRSQMKFSASNS